MNKNKRPDEKHETAFLQEELSKIFNQHFNKSFNHKQLAKLLKPMYLNFLQSKSKENISDEGLKSLLKKKIISVLEELTAKGDLIEVQHGSYKLKPKHAYMEGTIDITPQGAAYILSENDEDDIYIAPGNVKNALNGDRVKIYLYARHKNKRMEGEVVEVLKRSRTEFVGKVKLSVNYAFVIPDSPKMHVDIFIPGDKINKAKDGQKVLATISDWLPGTKNPVGEIKSLLGWPGENETEMNSILAEFGFPLEFPARVEEEADAIPETVSAKEISKRKDFRSTTTFTIDPIDAKDFDDALSFKKLETGNYQIGVHIADVSHYIRPNSFLDKEAYERGTSVYLVDRVIPMLPEKLSNGVCSLRPQEDKLCFAAVFEINEKAEVLSQWFGKTVIHSNKRFHYDEAQAVIETGQGLFSEEILALQSLAKKLRAERFRKGAIAFERAEVKFKLDAKGKPLGVYLKENKDANKLIEEFMLLANRTVAERVGKFHKVKSEISKRQSHEVKVDARPFVYRIHDGPVTDRIQNFARFANKWGYSLKINSDKEIAHSLNELMNDLRGKKEQNVLEQLAIRTMSKAMYTTDNIGHYGLAFDYYTHFTSPIRRYPDVLVHRLLEKYLSSDSDFSADKETLELQCKHSTQMEIRASEAERASVKYKQVEFLQNKIGQEFDGLISGVTEWGLFVELSENKCEGMIRLRDLDDDFYEFDETSYCVIGSRTKNKYTMGDVVRVQVVRCDLLKKQIDFRMINDETKTRDNTQTPRPFVARTKSNGSGKRFSGKGKSQGNSRKNWKGKR